MTIGIGFQCGDGIVLCADRQMTGAGGYKFEQCKIFYHVGGWTCVFCYAGDPDAASGMFDRISDGFQSEVLRSKARSPRRAGLAALEKIFRHRDAKELQTLVGVRFRFGNTQCSYLFKTSKHKVVDGNAQYIGVGDSSALRYLCNFLLGPPMVVEQAAVIGSYIISVANRYVDQCGGGPDRITLSQDGQVVEGTGGPWPNARERFLYCEEQIGSAMRELLASGATRVVETKRQRRQHKRAQAKPDKPDQDRESSSSSVASAEKSN